MYLAEKDHFYGIDKIRPHDFKEYLILTIDNKKKQNKRYPKSKYQLIIITDLSVACMKRLN